MSAFVVGIPHINVMVNAGMQFSSPGSDMRWLHPDVTEEDERDAYQRGEPWGPRAIELYRQRQHELTHATAESTGAMLLAENRASVDFRYDEEEWEEVYQFELISAPTERTLKRTGELLPDGRHRLRPVPPVTPVSGCHETPSLGATNDTPLVRDSPAQPRDLRSRLAAVVGATS